MRFDKGYISAYFVTDMERMEAVLEDAYVLVANSEDLLGQDPPAAGEGHAVGQAARHHRRGCRGRGAGDPGRQQDPRHLPLGRRQGARLRRPPQGHAGDIAILTGGRSSPRRSGLKLENVTLDLLGRARKVVVTKDETTIVEAHRTTAPPSRPGSNQIRRDREVGLRLRPREAPGAPAKLAGGVAVIKAGAATEVELKERKHRIGTPSATRRRPSGRASSPEAAWP